jgi:hypothetical protein
MLALVSCARPSTSSVELLGARSILLEGDLRVYELDRAAPIRLRGPHSEARLTLGEITHLLRPIATSTSWSEYSLQDYEGRGTLQTNNARFVVSIAAEVPELLGFRAIVETENGLEYELEHSPYFRIPSAEGWSIIRPELTHKDRELRIGDRLWRVRWVEKTSPDTIEARRFADAGDRAALRALADSLRGRAKLDTMTVLSGLVRKQDDGLSFAQILLETAQTALDAGVPSEASRMWRSAAYAYLDARRFAAVEPLLARAEALDTRLGNTSGLVRADYYRVVLATELGRYRAARQLIARAYQRAERNALDADRALLAVSSAMLSLHLGRHEEAIASLRSVEAHYLAQQPINRVLYLLDLGWKELKAIEAGLELSPDVPRRHLEDALALARSAGVKTEETNAIANLLWLAYLERDDAATNRWFAELLRQPDLNSSFSRPFIHLVRATLALKAGQTQEASAELAALRTIAELEAPDGSSEYLWRAAYGMGKVCRARGDENCAAARFAQAIKELELVSAGTDLGRSRALFLRDRRALFDDAIELALKTKRTADALNIADRARTGVLRALESAARTEQLDPGRVGEYLELRDRYERRKKEAELVSRETRAKYDAETVRMRAELQALFEIAYEAQPATRPYSGAALRAALSEGEQLLVYAPIRGRTDAFLVSRTSIEHHANGSALATNWPAAKHLYVVPGGQVDIAAVLSALANKPEKLQETSLSFLAHAGALLDDLPMLAGPPVVVADPDGTLPEARSEGSWVAEQLGVAPIAGVAAQRQTVLEAIRGASVFHFAGHGALNSAQPWDAHLALARGEALSLEDLLIARPAIGVVVLSGCRTGASSSLGEEKISLTQAFMSAGTRALMATITDVEDGSARTFVRRFYSAGGATKPIDAWRQAALESHAAGDDTWARYYVLGRRHDGAK